MIKGGIGGGNTTTGLTFEGRVDILSLLASKKGYEVEDDVVYYEGKQVALCLAKHKLYKWLETQGIDYKKIITKKLLPDEACMSSLTTLYM
jgi:hypothetical protein